MFKVIKLEGNWWAVFLVDQAGEERYMLTSPLDKQADAQHFMNEFYRLAESWCM